MVLNCGSLTKTSVKSWRRLIPCHKNFAPSFLTTKHELNRSATTSTGTNYYTFLSAKMAPKKNKRTADSINSRLALVMKSGKYVIQRF